MLQEVHPIERAPPRQTVVDEQAILRVEGFEAVPVTGVVGGGGLRKTSEALGEGRPLASEVACIQLGVCRVEIVGSENDRLADQAGRVGLDEMDQLALDAARVPDLSSVYEAAEAQPIASGGQQLCHLGGDAHPLARVVFDCLCLRPHRPSHPGAHHRTPATTSPTAADGSSPTWPPAGPASTPLSTWSRTTWTRPSRTSPGTGQPTGGPAGPSTLAPLPRTPGGHQRADHQATPSIHRPRAAALPARPLGTRPSGGHVTQRAPRQLRLPSWIPAGRCGFLVDPGSMLLSVSGRVAVAGEVGAAGEPR
jgi:hypothetical protein